MIIATLSLPASLAIYHPHVQCSLFELPLILHKKYSIHIGIRVILQSHIVQCVAANYWTQDTTPVGTLSLAVTQRYVAMHAQGALPFKKDKATRQKF